MLCLRFHEVVRLIEHLAMFLREYELRDDDTLIKYFYHDHTYRKPSLIIRLKIHSKSAYIKVNSYYVASNPMLICDELRRLLLLLDEPHWKQHISICSPEHRVKEPTLFD